ncbi:homing endonuclease associated repeat-containing protein [Methanobrevibacter sp.]|uniref:homing endonuclease associated repeat-containing protein n=1 Tax=Methanobrevibacter sp. TaxID=66852 RepID=UPI003890F919
MTPKNYVMSKFEGIVKKLDRVPTEEEFYNECLKESPVSTMREQVSRLFGGYDTLKEQSNYYQAMRKYLVEEVKKLARQLKATPTQEEFSKIVDRYYIRSFYESYNDLLKSAGLKPNKVGVGRKKVEEVK